LFLKGKIGIIRDDRYQINKKAIISLLIKLLSIILVTFILLKLVNYIFRNLDKSNHNNVDPQNLFIRAFFKTFIKMSIWSIAILLFLNYLGFQVGTILAGLGIGGFAIAIAAKETLSNILSGITLFIEKPFKIGDTIKIDKETPQKVVNMTWRSTQLVNSNLYYSNIPNSTVANANLVNFTKNNSSIDYVDIRLLPKYDSESVTSIMLQSLDKVGDIILQEGKKDVKLVSITIYSETPFAFYRIKFCIVDYHTRGAIRNKVLTQIKQDLEGNGILIDVDLKLRVLKSPS
jgi:small-conductance mechanosensitive channel